MRRRLRPKQVIAKELILAPIFKSQTEKMLLTLIQRNFLTLNELAPLRSVFQHHVLKRFWCAATRLCAERG